MASADAAKPASPPAADPPADDPMDADPAPPAVEEKEKEEEATPQKQPEKKRGGRRKKGEAAAAEKKTPPSKKSAGPTVERPSRERKTVERYAELAPRATPAKKSPAIVQGSGTKLKDIPNVSFKLSKRKVDENLQSLHTVLYGRKSNNHFLKRNISQFSGFVWTDNQEKQRNKIKEKLEKFNKEKLLDFCEVLDINVKVTTKKEEVSAKLLEFLESPCVTRDVVLTDKKKGKKRGRKSKATSEGASAEKKRKRVQKQAAEDGKENDDVDDADPAGSEDASTGEEADGDSEANDHAVSDDEPDEPPAKKKSTDAKQVKKETGSDAKEKDTPGKKSSTKPAKGASKPSQNSKNEPEAEVKKVGKRAKSSKESVVSPDSKSNKKVSKSKKDDGKETQNNKAARSSNKNKGKGKGGAAAGTAPTTEQLHAVVSSILKEVDFNTATLADILRQLGTHFEMDLMDRKAEVKRIIEEVINSMSDDEGEEDSEDEADDNGKVEKSKSDPDGGEEK
ncbi:hypothetical protein BDA96_03G441100 [Sorghum bicolor]|uniref:DEK-C domain-containing protein n=1 Tax=Sorghum bicolor TaxID=4558 RepID=A0A921UQR4_SORBI|nr:hypothetical protein BDA96_03G441100 [Sorghum bicolor]